MSGRRARVARHAGYIVTVLRIAPNAIQHCLDVTNAPPRGGLRYFVERAGRRPISSIICPA
jgi:hypothetical protein